MASIWNEALVGELKALWLAGWSAKLIGEKLGITRNAVLGKAHRLELPDREVKLTSERSVKALKPRLGQRVITRIQRANGNSNALRIVQSIEAEQYKLRCVEIVPRHLSLIELEAGDCRYPYGDETITFCGHPKHRDEYCMPHFHLTHEAPRYERVAA